MNSFNEAIHHLPILLILGTSIILAFYFGQAAKRIKLPTIIGFMLLGVLLGPSLMDILNDELQHNLSFITDIALGFVALSIGLELKMTTLKKLGPGIVWIILIESLGAFVLVTGCLYLLTGNLPMSLVFG